MTHRVFAFRKFEWTRWRLGAGRLKFELLGGSKPVAMVVMSRLDRNAVGGAAWRGAAGRRVARLMAAYLLVWPCSSHCSSSSVVGDGRFLHGLSVWARVEGHG